MPANDSILHRGVSAICKSHRYAPYGSNPLALKPHASCPPDFFRDASSSLSSSTPHISLSYTPGSASDTLSTATLVNPSFESDSDDPEPTPILSEAQTKPCDKSYAKELNSLPRQLGSKLNYIAVLIDFACQLMDDIWHTADIPPVFRYRHGANFGWTPETAELPVDIFKPRNCLSDLTPLPHFVMELLKRSRTNIPTIQTALCFLMVVRHKVPAIRQAEREGKGTRGEPVNNEGRIELDDDFAVENSMFSVPSYPSKLRKPPTLSASPLPQLPSPLLCPRRSFMGALVLSAKFVQDKCYSNRAWAKTCGLPAREVSRCERALGDALEWRLWVGKSCDMFSIPSPPDCGISRTTSCTSLLESHSIPEGTPSPTSTSNTCFSDDSVDGAATVVVSMEPEFGCSPTPSLTYSTSSGYSSGSLSPPSLSTPSLSFASNDPWFVPRTCRVDDLPCKLSQPLRPTFAHRSKSRLGTIHGRDDPDVFDMRVGYNVDDD